MMEFYEELELSFLFVFWLVLGLFEYFYLSWELMAAISFIFSIVAFGQLYSCLSNRFFDKE